MTAMCVPRHPPVSRQAPDPDKIWQLKKVQANSMSLVPEYGPRADRTGHRGPPPPGPRPFFERPEPRWLTRPPAARRQGLISSERARAGVLLAALAMLPGSFARTYAEIFACVVRGRTRSHAAGQCGRSFLAVSPRKKPRVYPSYSVTSKFCLSPHRRIDAISTGRRGPRFCSRSAVGGNDEVRSEVGYLALHRRGLRLYFLRVVRLRRALSAGRRVATGAVRLLRAEAHPDLSAHGPARPSRRARHAYRHAGSTAPVPTRAPDHQRFSSCWVSWRWRSRPAPAGTAT